MENITDAVKSEDDNQPSQSSKLFSDDADALPYVYEQVGGEVLSPSVYWSSDTEPTQSMSVYSVSDIDSVPLTSLHLASDFEQDQAKSTYVASEAGVVSSISRYTQSDTSPHNPTIIQTNTSEKNNSADNDRPSSAASQRCNPCKKKATNEIPIAHWYCDQCDELLCQDCKSDHDVLKLAVDHTVVNLNKSCDLCKRKNITAAADWWCNDCEDFLCSDCRSKHERFKKTKIHTFFTSLEKIIDKVKYSIRDSSSKSKELSIRHVDNSMQVVEKEKDTEDTTFKPFSQRKAKLINTYTVRVPSDANRPCIKSLIVLADGKLLLLDAGNKSLKMVNDNFLLLAETKFKKIPESMATYDEVEVVALFIDGSILTVAISKETLSIKKTISLDFSCRCWGLDFIDRGSLVVSGQEGSPSVIRFVWTKLYGSSGFFLLVCTTDGVKLSLFKTDSMGDSLFSFPYRITVDRKRAKIYVSNHGSSKICCLDANSIDVPRVKFTYHLPDLQEIRGMAIDRDGNIYVCAAGSRSIQQISPEGKYIQTLLTEKDGLNRPLSMTFNPKDNIFFIGSSDGGENSEIVQMFKMQ